MLISLRRMVGMPVVWQSRQIGHVEQALADQESRCLDGVVIRKGIGSARWCPAEAIEVIGEECLIVRQKPVRRPVEPVSVPGWAYLTSGQCIGEVTDAILSAATLRINALEVSPGPIYRLMGHCAYASSFRQTGSCVVVPALLSWTQLRRQLGEEEEK